MTTLLWLLAATALTVLGDYLIKLSTLHPEGGTQGLYSVSFALGALCYGAPALAWYMLMQSHSRSAFAVFYSSATLIVVALLGVVGFGEPFGRREGLAVALAVAAVVVMNHGD